MSVERSPVEPEKLAGSFRTHCETELARFLEAYEPGEDHVFELEYSDLFRMNSDLAMDYLDAPDTVAEWLAQGIATVDWQYEQIATRDVTVRVTGLPEHAVYDVGDWTLDDVEGSHVGIAGQVSKRTQKLQIFQTVVFECKQCGHRTKIDQEGDETMDEPGSCNSCEKRGPFIIVDDPEVEKDSYQRIRLQLPPEKAATASDETIDVLLYDDLVDNVVPGDRVVVNSDVESRVKYKNGKPTRLLELEGEARSLDIVDSDFDDVDIEEHRDRIEEIASGANPIEEIVASIAPSIKGRDELKEALAYQMFGGVEKELPDGARKRGTMHILVVGDPGCGKSALLQYAKRLAPRAVYTSGKQSTAAGLTCAAVQDDFGDGGWTIEAGALVEAHKGLAAIDEFDKMDEEDQSGVMQAMSEQEIAVSKAGINATLPAKTTVLAAANPRDGRFDTYEPVAGQIDLDPAIFSRFDLVFTISDTPDEELDREIASHMTRVARVGQQIASEDRVAGDDADAVTPPIEPEVMQAYIAYARRFTPVLSAEAQSRIVKEYVGLRGANDDDGPVPTTARMTEALIRLAEASARVRLSDIITEEDAMRAISIHRRCLQDIGVDPETGEFDADAIETGTTKSQRDRVQLVYQLVRELDQMDDHRYGAPHEKIVELGEQNGYDRDKIEKSIENLKQRRDGIYEPKDDYYKPS